jgi:hypothetical protein
MHNYNYNYNIKTVIKFIILIIGCIFLISYYYNNYVKEPFVDENSNDNNKKININISDSSMNRIAINNLRILNTILNTYSNLDAPITINNDGDICSQWGEYSNSKYSSFDNKCLVTDPTNNTRKCLNTSGDLSSCSNYYSDNTIDKLNIIDTKQIFDIAQNSIQTASIGIIEDISAKTDVLDVLINDIISKKNIEKQQLYFINYNKINLNDKQKAIDKTTDEFEKTENDININKINFDNFLSKNELNNIKQNTYYKIILGLIIVIVIIGVLNLLASKYY